jgi:glycosyltransferase involved in cell wall biosynthesis
MTSRPIPIAATEPIPATPPVGAEIELSVVMPCLNEADTVATCVRKAVRAIEEAGIAAEVLVADNGSTDGSQRLAEEAGARVVPAAERGYGNALMAGIAAARGRYILMGDADDSYDFGELPRYLAKLREGYDIVQGCRLPSGGGRIEQGAMPFLHRTIGNPMFSLLARWWFYVDLHDIYCGLRGFRKEAYLRLDQRCTGMEFATEMILKARRFKLSMAEVPITLHPDGRKAHRPHLRTYRDGWRTLRFFLLYAPKWLFLIPGFGLVLLGLLGYAIAWPGLRLWGVHFDVSTLVVSSVMLLVGYQSLVFAVSTKTFAIRQGFVPDERRMRLFHERLTLERCLLAGAVAVVGGIALIAAATRTWWLAGLGDLDYARTARWVIPGATLTAWGAQTIFGSFFLSVLNMLKK